MRITDTDARSYRKKEFAKVLEQHEKEKKDKYLQNCLEMRKDFTPMVYSVDGIAGREARNAEKRPVTHPGRPSGIMSILLRWCIM